MIQSLKLENAPDIRHVCKTLAYLTLNENRIQYLPVHYLENCDCLEEFVMMKNNVQIMPDVADVANTLRGIELARNRIESCGSLCETRMSALVMVGLGYNLLSHISLDTALLNWPRIRIVDLSNNRLQQLPDLSQLYPPYFTMNSRGIVYVTNNPLHCNSSMAWMMGKTYLV